MKIYDRQLLRVRESLLLLHGARKEASSNRETARGDKIIEPKVLLGWASGDWGNRKQPTGWFQEPRWCKHFRSNTGLMGSVWDEWKQAPVINPHLSSGWKMPRLKQRGARPGGEKKGGRGD